MTHQQHKTEYRDPRALRLHKSRAHFPTINKEALDWIAHTDSVGASGVLQPLLITSAGFIVDGGWRWEAAKDWQLENVPVTIIPDDMAELVMAETVICRKQMTRGAAVYLMIPLLKGIIQGAEIRRLANIQNGRHTSENELKAQCFSMSSNLTTGGSGSITALCGRWGITRETFYRAQLVWNMFNNPDCKALMGLYTSGKVKTPDLEELRKSQAQFKLELEPKLLIGDKNLWNVISIIAGSLVGGDPRKEPNQMEFYFEALNTLSAHAAHLKTPEKTASQTRQWLDDLRAEMIGQEDEFAEKVEQMAVTFKATHAEMQAYLRELAQARKLQTA